MEIWTLQTGSAGLQWRGGYTFIRRYTLPVIRDDEGIVPYGFYWGSRKNRGGIPGGGHASLSYIMV